MKMMNNNNQSPEAQYLIRPEGPFHPWASRSRRINSMTCWSMPSVTPNSSVRQCARGSRRNLTARYGVEVQQFEADQTNAKAQMGVRQQQIDRLLQQQDAMELNIGETIVGFPKGWLPQAWIAFLTTIAISLGLSEWLNMAGFVARRETHDLLAAMAFTLVVPLAALALKLPVPGNVRWLMRLLGTLAYVVGIAAGFCFIWQLAVLYASPSPPCTM